MMCHRKMARFQWDGIIIQLGTQYEYQFANREFLLNCIEYLVNNPAIIETRNKDIVLRLLDSKKVKEQKTIWQFINIALPVLLIILLGFIYQQCAKENMQLKKSQKPLYSIFVSTS